ncbi:unnamed protein product [Aphanomyces euteiches]|uniref:oligopeptidase A n=1 Tax=Aphanomyces euteiches TaxID=100861 RepID=A0A6G0XN76_9STRA|nr:hypothetical protein Ae201684_003122 [Aphanomyces euteiches]KAH9098659.1 hypothetical protein Ae201684P_017870 [Aphanomyces euteiches]KAH9135462.1 hypothetical protein AeRB84_019149 [Aphanomyces euteiches]
MVNPLTRCLEDYALPPFAQLRVSNIVPAIRTAIREYALDLNSIEDDLSFFEDDITWESVMDRLEIIDDPLNRLWRIVLHLSGVANSAELRDAKAEVQAEVLAIQSRRLQSVEIFEAMQTLRDGPHWAALSTEQQRMLDIAMLDMKLNGVTLTGGAKERFNEVNVRLKQLADIFSNNVLDATKSSELILHDRRQLEGVPDSLLAVFAREAVAAGYEGATAAKGPWKILLDLRNVLPVLRNSTNAATCEAVYRANRTRASSEPYDNTPVILEMLQLRQEMANLVGYPTFAEMNLADKMAPSVEVVLEMLHELRDKSFDIANDEMRELQAFAVAHGHVLPLQPWDYFHWVERMRKDKYDLDNELIRSYFPISTVLPKMFAFLSKLFGIRIETAEESAETWHPDVHYYQIRALEQVGEPVVAQFYLDLYARPGEKKTGAWIEVVAGRSRVLRSEKADVRLPVFALMFNHSAPVNDKPYLMTLADVQSTFTMLGFGLRVGLTAAEHAMATKPHGIEWDAVGFVPQFMQNFCLHKETILSLSSHVETGEPLPDDIFHRVKKASSFMRGTHFAAKFLELSAYDLALHHDFDPYSGSDAMFDIFRRTTQEFSRRPPFHDDKYICSLDYIFPGQYPSSYYSYVWSEMLATDAFACFAEAKSADELMALGRKFRDTILSMAGPRHPMEAFEKFRGRLPTTEGLLKQYGLE